VTKLNQIIAVEGGQKSRTNVDVTKVYHDLQKPVLFNGLSRVYRPKDEDGEQLPPEKTMVQRNVQGELNKLAESYTKLIDVTFTKDWANTEAKGKVVVGGRLLLEAPVPFLLFLKKQTDDLRTELGKLPVLDPSEIWHEDQTTGVYRTEPAGTTRTRKVKKVLVKYEATDKHPAQTETYDVDEIVGHWALTKFSGAVSQVRKDQLLDRVNELSDAVKVAIEEANSIEIEQCEVGSNIFDFLFAR
jgi:hypothetical protein